MSRPVLCLRPVWVRANDTEPCQQVAGHMGPCDRNHTIDPDSTVSDCEYGRRMAVADLRSGAVRADARHAANFRSMPIGWQSGYSWGFAHPEEEPGV